MSLYEQRISQLSNQSGRLRTIAAVSGGKDSVYMLLRLADDPRLDLMAYTLKTPFLSAAAKQRVDALCLSLRIPHIWVTPSFDQPAIAKSFVDSFGLFCPSCWLVVLSEGFRLAFTHNRSLLFLGLTPTQLLANCVSVHDHQGLGRYQREASIMYWRNAWTHVLHLLRIANKKSSHVESCFPFPHPELASELFDSIPDILFFYAYWPYNEAAILSYVHDRLGWHFEAYNRRLSHTDCIAHELAQFLISKTLGYSAIAGEVGVLIRHGQISRIKAFELLADSVKAPTADETELIEDTLHLSVKRMQKLAESVKPQWLVHYW